MTVMWLIIIGVLVVIELLTYGLYFAALAVAAIVPLLLSLLGFDLWVQSLGFLGAVIASLVYVRPLIKKLQGDKPEQMTNVSALIGKPAEVIEEISQFAGSAKIQGETWRARSITGTKAAGAKVVVDSIDGTTLIVR
ncbi:NfeD family protein [Candidatus Aquiluna sp. UB-MaderosW2red]|uniref:NfeD family protein n=1 Tax=Candidatus Aquiluna sp. UB-MaderosW2red TaxID=1855377 RepID=UPI000875EBEF|nr:NfeD family protein [Candidatus Aquiluna sp. UB-MaderosW2red]SCX03764.1 Membrane protein implicated in regulation of membrane protease activity [Candidatus Aquiluna sp. UB-MaderosW2red]